jgi:hypothetical protein
MVPAASRTRLLWISIEWPVCSVGEDAQEPIPGTVERA